MRSWYMRLGGMRVLSVDGVAATTGATGGGVMVQILVRMVEVNAADGGFGGRGLKSGDSLPRDRWGYGAGFWSLDHAATSD